MLSAVLLSGLVASTPVPAGVAPADWAQLEHGRIPARSEVGKNAAGDDMGRGVALALVDAPAGQVMDTIWDYARHAEFMPRVRETAVVAAPGEPHKRVRVTLGVLWKTIRYTLDVVRDPERSEIRWTLDKTADHDIADTTGAWRVVPLGPARTLVAYEAAVDSGFAMPRALQEYLTERDLPGLLEAVKRRVESGGTWRR